ncbi:MAG: hypothetical protein OEW30_02710, partial [Acidimicrobiia bacterium]|nr:hypothetical protein [Acidimicrobiia bacterium]
SLDREGPSLGDILAIAIRRLGGPASVLAGAAWLVIWFHQQQAHGPTQVNEMNVVWGMTWMDTGRLLVIPMALVLVGLAAIYQRREAPGRLGAMGSALTFVALGLLMAATLLEFGSFPWGSYERTFEEATGLAGSNPAGAIQSLMSLVFTVGLAILMTDLVRAKVVSIWVALVLVAGALATVFLSPVFFVPGLAWLVLGIVVWRGAKRVDAVTR